MTDPAIQRFVELYGRATAAGDAETLGTLFAPTFMTAGESGAQAVRASDLVRAIPQRRRMLEALGCQLPQLVSADETAIDARYSLVRTEWRWRVVRANEVVADLTLPSSFLVDRAGTLPQIVCYLPHQDITTVLRERGLLA